MYSDEMMKYLYSYNLPQKTDETEEKKPKGGSRNLLNTLNNFRNICATVPVEFHHEQGRT